MFDTRLKPHGFQKNKEGEYIYTKTFMFPESFPIFRKHDKKEQYLINKDDIIQYTDLYEQKADLPHIIITIPALIFGIFFYKLFLLLIPIGIMASNLRLKKAKKDAVKLTNDGE